MKYRYIGEHPAFIEGRKVAPGDVVTINAGTTVQTADVCDEPLFEAIVAATKKAATPAKEGK